MSRKPVIGANWKSNPASKSTVDELVKAFNETSWDGSKVDVCVFPTCLHAGMARDGFKKEISVGLQNVSKTGAGAFTGEWTAEMMAELGYEWCLIGHSERRSKYGETDEDTAIKMEKAQAAGIKVMFCIGESLEEREKGVTDAVNERQLKAVVGKISNWDLVTIAYEPVWAIGTGKTATPEMAQETHKAVRATVAKLAGDAVAAKVRIQYGGSSSPDNCEALFAQPDIDGFLVGGAALKPTFTKMITCLAK